MDIWVDPDLKKWFAWFPVKTLSGKYIWWEYCYRERWGVTPGLNIQGVNYYTPNEALIRKLTSVGLTQ